MMKAPGRAKDRTGKCIRESLGEGQDSSSAHHYDLWPSRCRYVVSDPPASEAIRETASRFVSISPRGHERHETLSSSMALSGS